MEETVVMSIAFYAPMIDRYLNWNFVMEYVH